MRYGQGVALVLAAGSLYIASWVGLAVWVTMVDRARIRQRGGSPMMG